MVPILMYHQVSTTTPASYGRFTVTPEDFAQQMRLLVAWGYEAVSLERIITARAQRMSLPPRSVVITLDDGFDEAVRHAVPVLLEHGLTATFFVVAGLLGGTSEWTKWTRRCDMPLADAGAVRELSQAGFTVGSHTMTHRPLARLDPIECREELQASRACLEDLLGREVRDLSYPFGSANRAVRESAAECGYTAACSIRDGLSPATDDALMLHRVEVCGGESVDDFAWRLCTGQRTQCLPAVQ